MVVIDSILSGSKIINIRQKIRSPRSALSNRNTVQAPYNFKWWLVTIFKIKRKSAVNYNNLFLSNIIKILVCNLFS